MGVYRIPFFIILSRKSNVVFKTFKTMVLITECAFMALDTVMINYVIFHRERKEIFYLYTHHIIYTVVGVDIWLRERKLASTTSWATLSK